MEKGGVVCSKESPRPLQCDPNEPGSCCGTGINSMADLTNFRQGMAFLLSSPFVNICNAPLSRLTILSQVQGMYSSSGAMSKLGLHREFSSIVKGEGFKALWKGNLASIVSHPPCLAITLLTYHGLCQAMQSVFGFDTNEDREASATEVFVHSVSAGLSWCTGTSAVYPMDLVRARLAAQRSKLRYKGIGHAFRTIYREEGFLGLYKGNGASVLRVSSRVGICTYVGELILPNWESQRPDEYEFLKVISSLGICGLISLMATHPIDLVKRRLQLDGGGGQPRLYNDGLFGTFKSILKTEGPRGLYRGVLPEFLKLFPRVGLFFMFYEIFKRKNAFSDMLTIEQPFAEPRHS